LEAEKAAREARTADDLKAELESKLAGAAARHDAATAARVEHARAEVTKAKAIAETHAHHAGDAAASGDGAAGGGDAAPAPAAAPTPAAAPAPASA